MDMTVGLRQQDTGRQAYRLIRRETERLEEAAVTGMKNGAVQEEAKTGAGMTVFTENRRGTAVRTKTESRTETKAGTETNSGTKTEESRVFPARTDVFEAMTGRKETGIFSRTLSEAVGQPAEDEDSGFQLRSKTSEDSVGQLAAQLARAESRVDVLQVSSRAMRALMNLKMASASCDEKEAKKIAQKIRRMEKLIKRINKKLKHLNQEEVLENQRKQAEKKQDFKKADELSEELQSRKSKRHKDERKYALKEMETDAKEENGEMMSGIAGASAPSDILSVPDLGAAAMTAAETGVSLNITV